MIAKDFIYCRPDTEAEAVEAHTRYEDEGKRVLYYGGGSEIITMATAGHIEPDVVIDLKAIPGCTVLYADGARLTIGGAVTLEAIRHSGCFPLLGTACGRIADHTNQCRITLGGNLCGTIIYRETSLPLLLADAELDLYGPSGGRTVSIHEAFDGRMKLEAGEFIRQVRLDARWAALPYAHIKRTAGEKIGYPAVTAAALYAEEQVRIAFSGLCHAPFRSLPMEDKLNDHALPLERRIDEAAAYLPSPPLTDVECSGAYRLHIAKIVMKQILEAKT